MHSSNAAVLAFTLLGCNEITSDPETPNFELVDPAQRLDAAAVNSHIYGSFRIRQASCGR